MTCRRSSQLAYQAIRIEGGLIPADELARLTTLQASDKTEQTEPHYGVPKGLKLRDEIARFWRIAQNLWADLQRQDINAHDATVREFLVPLLRDVLGLLNNLKSWYFPFEVNRATDHIDSLWGVFAAGIADADTNDDLAREELAAGRSRPMCC